VNPVYPSDEQIQLALKSLRAGGIVAYPTETFYGLAVDPENEQAVAALYDLKKRSRGKALSLLIPEKEFLSSITPSCPELYERLIDRFWPGPLTLIFKKRDNCLPFLTGNDGSVALRVSSHPVADELCQQWGKSITATSANLSGHPEMITAEDIDKLWGDRISYILDGGKTAGGPGSTIVRCDTDCVMCEIVRRGRITELEIRQTLLDADIVCKY